MDSGQHFLLDSSVIKFLIKFLSLTRIFPTIFILYNPFKIIEYFEMIKNLSFLKNDIVLDVGCGSGIQTLCIGKRVNNVIGFDINEGSLQDAIILSSNLKQRILVEFNFNSGADISFKENMFDKIFSFSVIEHIEDFNELFYEVYRVLKPGGTFVFSVDSLQNISDKSLIDEHMKKFYVVKYFKEDELKKHLENVGFEVGCIYPIFKSNFSKNLFIRGIKNDFKFSILMMPLYVLIMTIAEYFSRNESGVFIIVKCNK